MSANEHSLPKPLFVGPSTMAGIDRRYGEIYSGQTSVAAVAIAKARPCSRLASLADAETAMMRLLAARIRD
jgi:hypothetical protein